jgi:hypothetical protein
VSLDYSHVNWVAVVVAAVANIVIALIWYNPAVLGRRYATAIGREPVNPAQVPPTTWVIGIVQALLVVYVLALFAGGLGAKTLVDGAIVGFLAWVFVASAGYSSVTFEGRSLEWWAIGTGYYLVGAVVAGAIIGYWPA